MSTPNPVTFTPLVKGFSWTLATTAAGGNPLPSGEAETGCTIGIRADGDTAHAAGNYQYLAIVPAGAASETPAQLVAALGKNLAPGNYWAAIDQTDVLNGVQSTGAWSPEVAFSIPTPPPVIVQPGSPSAFSAS